MACNQTLSGLLKDCSSSAGGIKEVLLANKESIGEITITDEMVAAIASGEGQFKRYSFNKNTGSMTSTYNINIENGTRYVATDIVLFFNKMETLKRVEIMAMAQNDLVAIVKDANGKYWLLGKDDPVYATAGGGETGTAMGDRNGYPITLHEEAAVLPYEVDASIIATLVA